MCTICAAFRPTDTTCIYTYFDQEKAAALPGQDVAYDVTAITGTGDATEDEMEFAGTETVGNEGPDAANGQGTIYALDVTGAPQTFDGEIDFAGDRDWVQVTLTAGEYYAFEVSQRGSTPLNDSFLRLRDADGTIIKLNDDAGPGNQAAIFYQAEQTGTYYIDVGSYVNATNQSEFGTGSYRLTVSEFNPDMSIVSHDELADYLTDGFWSTRGGPWGVFDDTTTVITVDIDGLTADGQRLAKWAMQSYEMFLDIEFQIVSNGADIIFDDEVLNSAYASPVSSPTWPWGVDYIEVNVGRSWLSSYGTDVNDYTFQTYIHEIGHALGLGHQGDYNGSANFEVDFSSTANTNDFLNDFTLNSIMSYMDPNDNPFFGSSPASIVTPMLVDIIALQNIFGTPDANSTPTAGDTVWGKGHTFADAFAGGDIGTGSGSYLAALFDYAETGQDPNGWFDNSHVAFTIYDTSGHDLIDFSFDFTDQFVSLEAETLSTVFNPYLVGRNDNMWIARGTQIEDYYAGTGNDSITGNDVANVIKGNEGDDTIFGGGGNDSLEGGAGNDVIEGGLGDDLVEGGAGDDLLIDGSGNDTYFGGDGIDTVEFFANADEFIFAIEDDGKLSMARGGFKDLIDHTVEFVKFTDSTLNYDAVLAMASPSINLTDLHGSTMSVEMSSAFSSSFGDTMMLDSDAFSTAITRNGSEEWIRLDLGDVLELTSIQLTNRSVVGDRLNGAQVSLLDENGTVVHTFDPITGATDGEVLEFTLDAPTTAHYVYIDGAPNEYLQIAEIDVFGLQPVNYSPSINLTDLHGSTMSVEMSSAFSSSFGDTMMLDSDAFSTAITRNGSEEWIRLDLGDVLELTSIQLTNRSVVGDRLNGAQVSLLDENGTVVHTFDPITGATDGEVLEFTLDAPTTAHYVYIDGAPNEYLQIAEIDVFGLQPVNYSPSINLTDLHGSTMSVEMSSAFSSSFGGTMMLDSDAFSTAITRNGSEEWIRLDLGDVLELTSIQLTNRSVVGDRLNGAQVSLLDENGTVVHTFDPITGATDGEVLEFTLDAPTTAHYVYIDGAPNEYLQIAEIDVFGF